MNLRIEGHVVDQAAIRGIPLSLIEHVMRNPAQSFPSEKGRTILQAPVELDGKAMLLRVVTRVEEELGVKTLVAYTAYATRLGRYGS